MIAIVMPAYNAEKYIRESIQSVLDDVDDVRVIVIDDGSKDATVSIVKEIQSVDDRVMLLIGEHRGVSSARNMALDAIRGINSVEYVAFLDSDDVYIKGALNEAIKACKKHKADVCAFSFYSFYKNGKKTNSPQKDVRVFDGDGVWCYFWSLDEHAKRVPQTSTNAHFLGNKLFTRRSLKSLRFKENLSMGEDQLFLAEIFMEGVRVVSIPFYGLLYRQRVGSLSKEQSKKIEGLIPLYLAYKKIFQGTNDKDFVLRKGLYGGLVSLLWETVKGRIMSGRAGLDCFLRDEVDFLKKCESISFDRKDKKRIFLMRMPNFLLSIYFKGLSKKRMECPDTFFE